MSIYCSDLTFDGDEGTKRPIIYQGSHILPSNKDKRGGEFGVSAIPSHITRDGRDNKPEGQWHPWLRVHLRADTGNTIVLTSKQVEALRDALNRWLEAQVLKR